MQFVDYLEVLHQYEQPMHDLSKVIHVVVGRVSMNEKQISVKQKKTERNKHHSRRQILNSMHHVLAFDLHFPF